jgi:TP901 family phage tail tape measure protein
MNRSLGGIGRMVARSGAVIAGGFAGFGVASLKAAGDFEQTLNTFQAVTKSTGKEMKAVSSLAKSLGRDLTLPNTSAKDAAEAMTELAKGGLSVNQVLGATKGVLQLSTAAQIGNAEAAKITARALSAFNLEGTEAGRVADILTNAANASTGEINDFAMGLQMSAAVASQFGVSINENVAALMALADAGIVGSDAGTSLKTMFQRLVPHTDQAKALMKDLGINVFDAHGKFIGIQPALQEYSQGLEGLTQKQKIAALQTLFGADAIRAANILLKDGGKGLAEYVKKTEQQGSAAALAAAKTKGFAGALEGFKSTFETLLITAGTPLLKFGTTVVRGLSGAVAAFDTFVQKIAAAKTIQAKFQVVWSGVQGAAQSLAAQFSKFFVDGWTTESARMGDAAGAGPMKTFHAGLLAQVAGLNWTGVGTKITDGILGGIKEAPKIGKRLAAIIESTMAAVPWDKVGITLGPALVTAFASAIITALDPVFWAKHWELALALGVAVFGKGLGKFAAKLVPLLSSKLVAAAAAGTLRFSGRLSGLLFDAFVIAAQGVARGGALLTKGVGKAVSSAFAAIRGLGGRLGGVLAFTVKVLGIEAAIRALTGFAADAGSAVADAASAVASAASGIWQSISAAFGRALDWLRSNWPEVATIVSGPFAPIVALATDAFGIRTALVNALSGLAGQVAGLASGIGTSIVSGITGGVGDAAGSVVSAMSAVVSAVSGAVGRASSAATAIGTGIVSGVKGGVAGVVGWLASQVGALVSAVSGAVGAATGAATRWGAGVLSGIRSGLADLVGLVTRSISTAVAAVTGAIGTAASAAARLGAGILSGIRNGVAPIVGLVAGRIGAVVATVSGAVGRALTAATAVGAAIVDGIVRGLVSLVQEVKGSLDRLWGVISGVAASAYGAAVAIGSAIVSGIVAGLAGLVGQVAGKIASSVNSAISSAKGLITGSPHATEAVPIGTAIMEGVIKGVRDSLVRGGKEIADATKEALAIGKQIGPALAAAARVLGASHAKGIVFGFLQQAPGIGQEIAQALRDATKIAELATEAAKTIGRRQAQAIVEGFKEKEPGIVQQHRIAFDQAKQVMAIVAANAKVLGRAHAQAIANGITEGSPAIPAQVRQAMAEAKKALRDAARDAVSSARDAFVSGFSSLASAGLAAFDSQVAKWKSPFRLQIEKAQIDDQIKQLRDAITAGATGVQEAQAGLAEAMAGGDPEKIKTAQAAVLAAQNTMAQAVRAQQLFNLEQAAKADEEAHAKKMERQRFRFQERLTALQNELAAEQRVLAKAQASGDPEAIKRAKANIQETQGEILGAMKQYIPEFKLAGSAIGYEIAKGIREALTEVRKAAQVLALAMRKMLKLKSNAEEGPLADLDTWWTALPATLVAGMDYAPLRGAGNSIAMSLRGGIDESIGAGDPLAKFGSSLATSVGNLKTSFSGLEEATRPAAGALTIFGEPLEKLAGSASNVATHLGLATGKVTGLPPKLVDLGKTIDELEPSLTKNLIEKVIALDGAAKKAVQDIGNLRDELALLDGMSATTSVSNYITNYVKTVDVSDGSTIPSPTPPGVPWVPPPGWSGGGGPPGLAAGGLVTKPTLALIGERGPEAVIPLKRGGLGGSGTSHVTINVAGHVLTERELIDLVTEGLHRKGRQGPLSLPA